LLINRMIRAVMDRHLIALHDRAISDELLGAAVLFVNRVASRVGVRHLITIDDLSSVRHALFSNVLLVNRSHHRVGLLSADGVIDRPVACPRVFLDDRLVTDALPNAGGTTLFGATHGLGVARGATISSRGRCAPTEDSQRQGDFRRDT